MADRPPPASAEAARALLAAERADPASRPDLRFVLALYAAREEGRALDAAETARAAALPEPAAAQYLAEYLESGLLAADPDAPPGRPRYRLTATTAADAALMIEALTLAATPARAAAPPPPPARRPAPPASQW